MLGKLKSVVLDTMEPCFIAWKRATVQMISNTCLNLKKYISIVSSHSNSGFMYHALIQGKKLEK